jgi:hypothetical protein
VVGGKAEDSANEHDDKSEASDKAISRSESAEPSPLSPLQAKALDKGKGKMVQGRRTDSASSLRCAQHAGMCRHHAVIPWLHHSTVIRCFHPV